jgi:hypothetical protein
MSKSEIFIIFKAELKENLFLRQKKYHNTLPIKNIIYFIINFRIT